jgi:2-phosphosulfolactate phosphatase
MIDVILNPADLAAGASSSFSRAQVVVLDILRATSTIVTALHNGARDIVMFDSLDSARAAKASGHFAPPTVLAGESKCLKPDDFDLGNSPREHVTEKIGGATVLLATTNGTRAANLARASRRLYVASLLNASATAQALAENVDAGDTIFVCAGTNGALAFEDVIGAGAILWHLLQTTYRADLPFTDRSWLAYHAFSGVRNHLGPALRLGAGGINVIEAGLEDDIDHCARLDAMPLVANVDESLRVRKG